MAARRFELRKNATVDACPKCGNNTEFTGHSERCAEDCCEVWVVCKCGFDPTAERPDQRLEDTWGGLDNARLHVALHCWNESLRSNAQLSGAQRPLE